MAKRRNNPGNNGKHLSPRRGEKSKQTKVTQAKESETKGAKQTKLAFAATGTPENTKNTSENEQWPKLSFASAVTGTPPNAKVLQTKAITPEVNRLTHPTPPTTPDIPQKDPPQSKHKNNEQEKHDSNDDDDNKKPAATKRIKIVTHEAPIAITKNLKATYNTPEKYRAIRYNGQIETPPSDKPFEPFRDMSLLHS